MWRVGVCDGEWLVDVGVRACGCVVVVVVVEGEGG